MPRRPSLSADDFLQTLQGLEPNVESLDQGLTLLGRLRASSNAEQHQQLDRGLLRHLLRHRKSLEELRETQEALRAELDTMTSAPWFPAVFLRQVATRIGSKALVASAEQHRLVDLSEEVDPEDLSPGDPVFLSHQLNVLMAQAPEGLESTGETASFDRV